MKYVLYCGSTCRTVVRKVHVMDGAEPTMVLENKSTLKPLASYYSSTYEYRIVLSHKHPILLQRIEFHPTLIVKLLLVVANDDAATLQASKKIARKTPSKSRKSGAPSGTNLGRGPPYTALVAHQRRRLQTRGYTPGHRRQSLDGTDETAPSAFFCHASISWRHDKKKTRVV